MYYVYLKESKSDGAKYTFLSGNMFPLWVINGIKAYMRLEKIDCPYLHCTTMVVHSSKVEKEYNEWLITFGSDTISFLITQHIK